MISPVLPLFMLMPVEIPYSESRGNLELEDYLPKL